MYLEMAGFFQLLFRYFIVLQCLNCTFSDSYARTVLNKIEYCLLNIPITVQYFFLISPAEDSWTFGARTIGSLTFSCQEPPNWSVAIFEPSFCLDSCPKDSCVTPGGPERQRGCCSSAVHSAWSTRADANILVLILDVLCINFGCVSLSESGVFSKEAQQDSWETKRPRRKTIRISGQTTD